MRVDLLDMVHESRLDFAFAPWIGGSKEVKQVRIFDSVERSGWFRMRAADLSLTGI